MIKDYTFSSKLIYTSHFHFAIHRSSYPFSSLLVLLSSLSSHQHYILLFGITFSNVSYAYFISFKRCIIVHYETCKILTSISFFLFYSYFAFSSLFSSFFVFFSRMIFLFISPVLFFFITENARRERSVTS